MKFLVAITFIIFFSSINYSFASQSVREVVGDENNNLVYRDISNTSTTPTPTISTDKVKYGIGERVNLTINDFNGNLDTNSIDKVSATVDFGTSTLQVDLFESDVNSGVFYGNFISQGSFSILYDPDPPESPRASVDLDVVDGGNIILKDVIIDDNEIQNMCFYPATHAFELSTDGASLGDDSSVTISFANALLYPYDDPLYLQMYYKSDEGWQIVTPNFFVLDGLGDYSSFNFIDKTITSNPSAAATVSNGYSSPIKEGQYILGIETSCGGGGGGGLIRPGLVLNLLAGIGSGAGKDVSPPSLHFGTPTNTEADFAGILVTDENKNSFPLVINGNGYYLPEFSTTIDPVKVNTGQDVSLTLTFLESTGVQDVALHFVDENNSEMSENDPIITFYNGSVTKSDPDGILSDDITFSNSKDGNKYSYNFGFSFDQPGIRHLMITAWDDNKNSGNTKVFNAFSVSGNPVPDDGTGHMIYLDLGAYYITTEGILKAGEKTQASQPVIEYDYPDSVGRVDRHDGLFDQIENEKNKAGQVVSDKFNLDTETFVEDQTKQIDSRRAPELTLSHIGHKIRDFTLTPEENKELIQKLALQEEIKAKKILDSMCPNLNSIG